MAVTRSNIFVGGGVLSVGAWVTAGGAGSLTDVGAIKGGVTLERTSNYHDIEADRHLGILDKVKVQDTYSIKCELEEATIDNLITAMDQATSAKSGTPPDLTLRHDPDADAQPLQVQVVGKGPGTTNTRTLTAWRGIVTELGPIAQKKDDETRLAITIALMQDLSLATADKDFKIVDS